MSDLADTSCDACVQHIMVTLVCFSGQLLSQSTKGWLSAAICQPRRAVIVQAITSRCRMENSTSGGGNFTYTEEQQRSRKQFTVVRQ